MILKCPICCTNAEITNKKLAHEKIKAECYCAECDANFEVIYPIPPGSKGFDIFSLGIPV